MDGKQRLRTLFDILFNIKNLLASGLLLTKTIRKHFSLLEINVNTEIKIYTN